MQVKEYNYKGRKLVYRIKGEGPVIILLHGFGEDGTIWRNQYDLFSNHQLIIPDLPGSGRSEMIDDMSMEGMADAIKSLLLELRSQPSLASNGGGTANTQPLLVEQSIPNSVSSQSGVSALANSPLGHKGAGFILIGHSMGGYIALAYAEKYPETLNAFGLFHSTAYADSEEKKEVRRKGIEFMEQQGSEAFLKTATPNLFSSISKEKDPQLIDKQLQEAGNFLPAALVSYYEAMIKRPDRTVVLQNCRIPVLFVMGREDIAVPLEDGLKLCHLPQLSYIHILANSGHMGMIEEVAESNKILSEFITTVEKKAYT